MRPIITVENLSKRYTLGVRASPYSTLRESITNVMRAPFRRRPREGPRETIWALNDVSFEVRPGEILGIVGRNGAGKSTLLKVLSRITEPTRGRVKLYGRVGSLLEVGTGFHPELTGRENIFLNGAILGMGRREIDRKFEEIVAFAETERFLDTPVKHYSSGMYMRLAFAVAAHLEPEILVVDEVLAVGDAAFQKKCLGKMGQVAGEGRTVLFVSHNMGAIESLCRSAFLLDRGRLVLTGETRAVIDAYLRTVETQNAHNLEERRDREGDGRLRLTSLVYRNASGQLVEFTQTGQPMEFSVGFTRGLEAVRNVALYIGIFTVSGQCLLLLGNEMVGTEFDSVPASGRFSCLIERFPLLDGQYTVTLFCTVNGVIADWIQRAADLTVESGDFFGTGRLAPQHSGGVLVDHDWRLIGVEEDSPQA